MNMQHQVTICVCEWNADYKGDASETLLSHILEMEFRLFPIWLFVKP